MINETSSVSMKLICLKWLVRSLSERMKLKITLQGIKYEIHFIALK